jgi:hypothetical protein
MEHWNSLKPISHLGGSTRTKDTEFRSTFFSSVQLDPGIAHGFLYIWQADKLVFRPLHSSLDTRQRSMRSTHYDSRERIKPVRLCFPDIFLRVPLSVAPVNVAQKKVGQFFGTVVTDCRKRPSTAGARSGWDHRLAGTDEIGWTEACGGEHRSQDSLIGFCSARDQYDRCPLRGLYKAPSSPPSSIPPHLASPCRPQETPTSSPTSSRAPPWTSPATTRDQSSASTFTEETTRRHAIHSDSSISIVDLTQISDRSGALFSTATVGPSRTLATSISI